MFERFLERLSLSIYKEKFILKGGMLIAAIVGVDMRSTMDLDATIRGMRLSEDSIREALLEVCDIPIDDNVSMRLKGIGPIRPDDVYGGYRAKIAAIYDTIETPFSVDITTGDVITPRPERYAFRGIFDEDKRIEVWAYNIETVIAEKAETVLRRNVLNTRARDFYDIYILSATQAFDRTLVKEAIAATAEHRGSTEQIADTEGLLTIIEASRELRAMWEKYRREFSYAAEITWDMVVDSLRGLLLSL